MIQENASYKVFFLIWYASISPYLTDKHSAADAELRGGGDPGRAARAQRGGAEDAGDAVGLDEQGGVDEG